MKEIIVYLFTFAITSFILNLFPQQKKILPIPHLSTSTSIIILDGSTSYHPSLPLYQRIYIANQRVSITAENISFIRLIKREQEMTGIIHTYSSLQFLKGVVDVRFLDGANLFRFMDKMLIVPIRPEECFGFIERRATGETLCRMQINSISIVQIVIGTQQKIDEEAATEQIEQPLPNNQAHFEEIAIEKEQEQIVTNETQAQTSMRIEEQQGFIKQEQSKLQSAHEQEFINQYQTEAILDNIPSPQTFEPENSIIEEESIQKIEQHQLQLQTSDDGSENEQQVEEEPQGEQYPQQEPLASTVEEEQQEHADQAEEYEQQELVDGQQDKEIEQDLPIRQVYYFEQTPQEQGMDAKPTSNQEVQSQKTEETEQSPTNGSHVPISHQIIESNNRSNQEVIQGPKKINNDQIDVQVKSKEQIGQQDDEAANIPLNQEEIEAKFINKQQISSIPAQQQSTAEIISSEQPETNIQLKNAEQPLSTPESIADKLKKNQLELISQGLQRMQKSTVEFGEPHSDTIKQQSIKQSQQSSNNNGANSPQQIQIPSIIQTQSKDAFIIEFNQQKHNEQPQFAQDLEEQQQNRQTFGTNQQNQEQPSLQLVNDQIFDNLPQKFLIS